MSAHAVLASTTLVAAGAAALGALAYAWAPSVRRLGRWPLVVTSVVASVLSFIAADAGSTLLRSVEASASTAEVEAAQAHGHSADAFVSAIICLLIVALATVWGSLRPGRNHRGTGTWIGALVLTAAAAATLATGGLVLNAALDATSG
jgi:hypothetical protein